MTRRDGLVKKLCRGRDVGIYISCKDRLWGGRAYVVRLVEEKSERGVVYCAEREWVKSLL